MSLVSDTEPYLSSERIHDNVLDWIFPERATKPVGHRTNWPLLNQVNRIAADGTTDNSASQSGSSQAVIKNPTVNSSLPAHRGRSVDSNRTTSTSVSGPTTTATSKSSIDSSGKQPMSRNIEMQRLNSYDQSSFDTSAEAAGRGRANSNQVMSFIRKHSIRHAPVDQRVVMIAGTHHFMDNSIATAKYNLLTFIPKFLFEQFRKYANIFFLFIALMQQIPNVSPTGRYTTAVPLCCILLVSAVKEIFEDIKRHHADYTVNVTEVLVLNRFARNFTPRKWKDIRVGDLVLVKKNNFFPSDLVLFSSNEPNGVCYIETANLDGETNLKARSSLTTTDEICSKTATNKEVDIERLCSSNLLMAEIRCDTPNKHLYEFVGKIKVDNSEMPIGPENILLRGAKLRNTEWALGCAIYTGHETKLMMNSLSKAPLKQSLVEISTNRQILSLLGILILICFVSAVCSVLWTKSNQSHWYLDGLQSKMSSNFFLIMLTFIILYNNLIPISLQVTLEMVRFIQAHFINCDLAMYHEETDTPAMARTSNLNEELGQVQYILSDKTGTLTQNVMEFKKCSINGVIYDDNSFYRLTEIIRRELSGWTTVREFMVLLSVCHTVIPEPNKSSQSKFRYTYQASSPDEAALVKGAQLIGFEFLQRTSNRVVIDAIGTNEKYEVLNVLEFTSDRKRMSVIVRCPKGEIKIYTKGADSIIQQRLCEDSANHFSVTEDNLGKFASDGLRTLCCAYSVISEKQYEDWNRRWTEALLNHEADREDRLNELMSEIETDLILLGATAIEDKLQVGVPETIELLMKAGISIWMLTGDKQETAINIGYSCRLLKNVQAFESYHIVNEQTLDATRDSIAMAENKLNSHPEDFTLIINTKSLNFALKPELQSTFMLVALRCRSVICCRVSPSQKAEIVQAVKSSTNSITLAIGDGANDVAMIRAAHVGVGISGLEGLQAVYSSDYAIAQFRFLGRLLLVHGSWSLSRVCKLILYSFYKNIALYVIELWFASISAWSGQAVFERWSIGLYNVIFTAAPPVVMGLFDRICSAEIMMNNPELYKDHSSVFSIKLFWLWICSAIWHSLVLFWLTYYTVDHDALWANGHSDGGYLCFGNILYTYVVITVCLKAALETSCWTSLTHLAIWGSIASWFVFLLVYCRVWPTLPLGADISSVDTIIFTTSIFWLGMAIIPFSALLIDIVTKLIVRTCFKTLADKITELELAKSAVNNQTSISAQARKVLSSIIPGKGQSSSVNEDLERKKTIRSLSDLERDALHGYSFSQEEGSRSLPQSDLVRIYNTKM